MAAPTIHIISKSAYSTHTLVTLPTSASPSSPLSPSSLRLRSKILSLTTNNLTYARLGAFLGWWDLYTLPPSTPEPYNDPENYGRISAWGYAEILDSTVDGIKEGASVFGYFPIGTLPVDVHVESAGFEGQYLVKDAHRQHLWIIYNRLTIHPSLPTSPEPTEELDSLGWDSLLDGLFATGYNLNRYGFSWTPEHLTHPAGLGNWTSQDADLKGASVVILNASGKTGLSFAHQVRHNRPKDFQPKSVIGACSGRSRSIVEKTGFYDDVVSYDEIEDLKAKFQKDAPSRIVLFDFGARSGARSSFDASLQSLSSSYTLILIGSEVEVQTLEEVKKGLAASSGIIQVNANVLRESGIAIAGDAYFKEFSRIFREFKAGGAIPGVNLKWGKGIEEFEKGWESLCKDEVGADIGLVYWI